MYSYRGGRRRQLAFAGVLLGASSTACFYNPQGGDSGASTGSTTDAGAVTTTAGTTDCVTACGEPDTDPTTSTSTSGTTVEPTTEQQSDATSATTGAASCAGEVVDNAMCGGLAPYCIDNGCVGCTEVACTDLSPDKPACSRDTGHCVECLQSGDCLDPARPSCDLATATCGPCTGHDACPDTACNLETGACFPADSVLYVENSPAGDFPCSDAKSPWGMTPEEPICTLQTAISRLVEGQPTTIKIKAAIKQQNLPSALPAGDYIVAIVHYGATVPSLVVSVADPALTVSQDNTVFMRRIAVYNSQPISDPLIACDGGATGARLWLDQQRIYNGRTAIRAQNCRVHLRRAIVTGHTLGGIEITGTDVELAALTLENSYITDNNGSKFGGVRLQAAVDASFVYSTLALNNSVVAPIDCVGLWSGALNIRNSAIVGPLPHFGAGCDGPAPADSLAIDASQKNELGQVFSGFSDGVFQAKIGGQLADVAVWKAGDPATDQDGTLRPTADGAPDYAGADRPVR